MVKRSLTSRKVHSGGKMKQLGYLSTANPIKFPRVTLPSNTNSSTEKIPMGNLMGNSQLNINKMAFLVNVIYSLADIINGLAVDAESELKNVDPSLGLDLMHPVQRIKIHSSEMVRFVDEYVGGKFSEGFGEASDEMREIVLEFYNNLMKKEDK